MSAESQRAALLAAVADGVDAVARYEKLPGKPPARYPCVVTQWLQSVPEAVTFTGMGGNVSRRRWTHTFEAIVLVGQLSQVGDADKEAVAASDAVIDALQDKSTLSGACIEAVVRRSQAERFTWDSTVIQGVTVEVDVTEDY